MAVANRVVTPADAAPWIPRAARIDTTLIKAIVRAHRWRDMLESGRYVTVRDLANAESMNESYLSRVLRLTLLASTIIEQILEANHRPILSWTICFNQCPSIGSNRMTNILLNKREPNFIPKHIRLAD
jgi:hypothetical protein